MRHNELLNIKKAHSEFEHRYDLSKEEKSQLFEKYLKQFSLGKADEKRVLKALSSEPLFREEYERLVNLELYSKALSSGAITYKSLTPCSSKKRTKSTCGNTVRYTSNRGCTLCQKTNPEAKRKRQEEALFIIEKHKNSTTKTKIVNELMSKLNLKKSAAYRLINLHRTEEALYQTKSEPSIEHDSSLLVSELASEADLGIEMNQDFDYYDAC